MPLAQSKGQETLARNIGDAPCLLDNAASHDSKGWIVMKTARVPKAAVHRLGLYIQALESPSLRGDKFISSSKLGQACSVTPAQVRKDLSYFGEFGVRGCGYIAQELLAEIQSTLGANHLWNVALVGTGCLGRSLLSNSALISRRLDIVAVFACDHRSIGRNLADHEIMPIRRIPEMVEMLDIKIGIIATPPWQAQVAANYFACTGVQGIINYSPVRLQVPPGLVVEHVDFFQPFSAVTFALKNRRAAVHRRAHNDDTGYAPLPYGGLEHATLASLGDGGLS